jgi:hypothetical protein
MAVTPAGQPGLAAGNFMLRIRLSIGDLRNRFKSGKFPDSDESLGLVS